MVGVEPRFEEYTGTDPLQFAVDANENRRHDTIGERAIAGAKLSNLKHGSNQFKKEETSADASSPIISIPKAAKIVGVGTASIDRAKAILASGDQELIKKVETGEVSIAKGAQLVRHSAGNDQPSQGAIVHDQPYSEGR